MSITRRHPRPFLTLLLSLALLIPSLATVPLARAAGPCDVTSTAGTGAVTFYDLIAGSCPAIGFVLPGSAPWTIALTTPLPIITRALTITGPGKDKLIIQGNGTSRVLHFDARGGVGNGPLHMPVTISGLTLTKGYATSYGGNLLSLQANLTLSDVALTFGTAPANSGGAGADIGGGTVTMDHVTVSDNTAPGSSQYQTGAGLYIEDYYGDADVTITNSMIVRNTATSYSGGGIAIVHDSTSATPPLLQVAITNTIVGTTGSPNHADSGAGGGIYLKGGMLTLTGSTVSGNQAIQGAGLSVSDDFATAGSSVSAKLTNTTISGNRAILGDGGGIRFGNNSKGGNASLILINSTVSDNSTASAGGGIYAENSTPSDGSYGGVTNLELSNVTVSGNRAAFTGGGVALNSIGGNTGYLTATLRFFTVTGNNGDSDGNGSGLGGGLAAGSVGPGGYIRVISSLVAGNLKGGAPDDCFGPITSQGRNLWGDHSPCPTDVVNGVDQDQNLVDLNKPISAVLNPILADNGGLTKTHALVLGSPAIDKGDNVTCAAAAPNGAGGIDQRGFGRPQGGSCDVGAYEARVLLLNTGTAGTGSGTVTPGGANLEGITVNVTATATGGSIFAGWTVDGSPAGTANPLSVIMGANHNVVATFTAPTTTPSPSPAASPVALTLTMAGSGSGTVGRDPLGGGSGPYTYTAGTVVTLTATAASGSTFAGWALDGTMVSWATSVTLTMNADHSVVATFAPLPGFGDVPGSAPYADPVRQLAARGVINGCDKEAVPPLFCPDDPTLRAQMAALIVRAMPGWVNESYGNTFTDPIPDTELWGRVATLQHYGVAQGYQAEVCQGQGKGVPCFGPLDPVTFGQTLLFVSRAMVTHGYWTLQPDDLTLFPELNGASDREIADHRAIVTYVHYAGAPPDVNAAPNTTFQVTGVPHGGWGDPSSRGWFARALWQALNTYFGADNLP
jgi:hypothetical protein